MTTRRSILGALAGSALCASAPMLARAQSSQVPVAVVASFSILGDMLKQLGGDAVDVAVLVGPNADAHTFEPAPADAQRVARADLVVINGLHFEGWIPRLAAASGYRGRTLVASESITPRRRRGIPDPHAWQDLSNGRIYVENIRSGLVRIAPALAQTINARAAAYTTLLSRADDEARSAFAAIPAANRRVLTSHEAFGYFGAAYGVDFLAAQGWNTDSEPSAAAVARLITQIKDTRVRAVFLESISDPRLVQRMAADTGATIGGTLYADALSMPGTGADTYLKMFQHNVRTLLTAIK